MTRAAVRVRRQCCSTDNRDVRVVSRFVNGRRKRTGIATGQEKALTLRGVLLEYLHGRKINIEPIGATQLLGQVIRGHAIEHIVDLRSRCRVLDIICAHRRLIQRRRTFVDQTLLNPGAMEIAISMSPVTSKE